MTQGQRREEGGEAAAGPSVSVARPARPKPMGNSTNEPSISMLDTRPNFSFGTNSCNKFVQIKLPTSSAAPLTALRMSHAPNGKAFAF